MNRVKSFFLAIKHRNFLNSDLSIYKKFLKKKSIFVHIPKTAGRSIINSIYGNDLKNCGHRTYFFYKCLFTKKRIQNMYTFSFVRNPYSRLFSAYNFLKKGGENLHDLNAKRDYIDCFKDFNEFINFGLESAVKNNVIHFVPQYNFITYKGDILIDYVGKFETLERDLKVISSKVDFESSFKLNKSKKNTYNFTQKNCDIIERVYLRDFLIFNYERKNA
tara:strand:- start:737 stop:1393 length:657 start_codon:yes stop_codon:yes gene_type:complete